MATSGGKLSYLVLMFGLVAVVNSQLVVNPSHITAAVKQSQYRTTHKLAVISVTGAPSGYFCYMNEVDANFKIQNLDNTDFHLYFISQSTPQPLPDTPGTYSFTGYCEAGNETADFAIDVFLRPNQPPVVTNGPSVTVSNVPVGTTKGNIVSRIIATDEDEDDTLTFTEVEGTDGFTIDSAGYILAKQDLPLLSSVTATLKASVSDGVNAAVPFVVHITLDKLNDPPVDNNIITSVEILESAKAGEEIYTLNVLDTTLFDKLDTTLTVSPVTSPQKFELNGNVISVVGPFDFKAQNEYTLTVGLSDGYKNTEYTITVTIKEANKPPECGQRSYSVSVLEGEAGSINIQPASFSVTDTKDTTFDIELGGLDTDFTIQSNDPLIIKPIKDIDCESTTVTYPVILPLVVKDSEQAEGYCDVTISCKDDNDNTPIPAKGFESFDVSIQTAKGVVIGNLAATDADKDAPNNQFEFVFVDSTPADAVVVFPTGQVVNNLDLSAPGVYDSVIQGQIIVRDKGATPLSSPIIFNYNWNKKPGFENFPNTATLSEDTEGRTKIVVIDTVDPENDPVTCSAGTITDNGPFDVGQDDADSSKCAVYYTGAKVLNTLNPKTIFIDVIAEDGNGGSETKQLKLVLIPNSKPTATCATDSPRPLRAPDIDSSSVIYKIPVTDNENDAISVKFTCDPRPELFVYDSTEVALVATTSFLSVSESSFTCTLNINDGKHPSPDEDIICVVSISVIDQNEPPDIRNDGTTKHVSELAPVGDTLATFDIFDVEKVTLRTVVISPAEGNTLFEVDKDTFEVKLIDPLDYETMPDKTFTITVTATDNYLESTGTITIEVLDDNDPPIFNPTSYSVTIKEGEELSVDEPLGLTVEDTDKDDVHTFRVLNEPTFGLTGTNLRNNKKLDLDVPNPVDVYNIKIEADDGNKGKATADVLVKVNHVNDHYPTFKAGAYSNCLIGTKWTGAKKICDGLAEDKDTGVLDKKLTYSLETSAYSDYFEMVENSIYQKKALEGFLYGQQITLTVKATDAGVDPGPLSDTIEVAMIWNKAPSCTIAASIDIHENAKIPTELINSDIAMSDPENDPIQAVIECFPQQNNFRVSPQGATSAVLEFWDGALSFKDHPKYSCTVTCTDEQGGSDKKNVTINVTKNRAPNPDCNPPLEFELDAVANKRGDALGPLPSTDPENDDITFSAVIGSADNILQVDSGTGHILVIGDLTQLEKDRIDITATLTDPYDNTATCKAVVKVVNINEAPILRPTKLREFKPEDTAPGELFRVKVEDEVECLSGTTVSYDIEPASSDSLYEVAIEGAVGAKEVVVSLRDGQKLDYETQKEFEFFLQVNDGCLQSEKIAVYLDVDDVNEPPTVKSGATYSATFKENDQGQCLELGCDLKDEDVGDAENMKWTLTGTESESFTVSGVNCLFCMQLPVDLDPLNTGDSKDYTITVEGEDKGGEKVTFDVLATIMEENDNAPEFDQGSYAGTIMSTDPVGKVIVAMPVTDKDANDNGRFYCYGFECDPAIESYITISSTCEVRLESSMSNFASSGSFKCKVGAEDYGDPALKSESKIDIFFELVTTQPPPPAVTQDPNGNDNNGGADSGANSGSGSGSGSASGSGSGSGSGTGSGSGLNSALNSLANGGSGGSGTGTNLGPGAIAGMVVGALAVGAVLAAAIAGLAMYAKKKCAARSARKQNTRTYKVSSRESYVKNNKVSTASSVKVNMMNDPGYGHTQVRHLPY